MMIQQQAQKGKQTHAYNTNHQKIHDQFSTASMQQFQTLYRRRLWRQKIFPLHKHNERLSTMMLQ